MKDNPHNLNLGTRSICFYVENVEAERARLVSNGIQATEVGQRNGKGNFAKDSLSYRKIKILSIIIIGVLISLWFYYKLEISSVNIPFGSSINLGMLFIPFFVIVMLATFSTSVIDGMDGLSGGIMASIFTAYSVIAYSNNQIDLSAFYAVIVTGKQIGRAHV